MTQVEQKCSQTRPHSDIPFTVEPGPMDRALEKHFLFLCFMNFMKQRSYPAFSVALVYSETPHYSLNNSPMLDVHGPRLAI